MDPRETAPDRGPLREAIEQEHARILGRLFGPPEGPAADPQLAPRYLDLIRGIAALSPRQLLGLQFLPGFADAVREGSGADGEAAEELALIRRMADASGDGFAVADARGELTYANPSLCRMYGETRSDDVVGVPMVIYLPEAWHTPFRTEIMPTVLREGSWVGELPVRSRAGTVTPAIQAFFVVHRGHGGGALRIAARVLDLSESKRMEADLRASEARYRELVETIDEVVFAVDPRGMITYMSPAIERLTGYTPAEARGRLVLSVTHPDDRALMAERFGRVAAREILEPHEYRIQHKNGEYRWMRISSRAIVRDGVVHEMRGTLVDVHARRMAEDALRESEVRYRELVETIDEGLFALDPQGTILFMSPGAGRIIGYNPGELVGQSITSFLHPDDLATRVARLERMRDGTSIEPQEYRIRRREGTYRWVRASTRPIMRDGRIFEVRGTLIDIQARKEVEEALRESEAKYAAVVEQAQIGVAIVQDGIVQYANRFVARMAGYTPEEIIGRSLFDFVDPADRVTQEEIHEHRMRGEDAPLRYTAVGRRRDGTVFRVENATVAIQYRGRPAALAVIRELKD
jgi:PAS domain S-box-containing protein